jgi:hypothetical protein
VSSGTQRAARAKRGCFIWEEGGGAQAAPRRGDPDCPAFLSRRWSRERGGGFGETCFCRWLKRTASANQGAADGPEDCRRTAAAPPAALHGAWSSGAFAPHCRRVRPAASSARLTPPTAHAVTRPMCWATGAAATMAGWTRSEPRQRRSAMKCCRDPTAGVCSSATTRFQTHGPCREPLMSAPEWMGSGQFAIVFPMASQIHSRRCLISRGSVDSGARLIAMCAIESPCRFAPDEWPG